MTKITYVNGNLLEASQTVIAHGCNTLGVMGAGVALAIRNKWPNVYHAYTVQCDEYARADRVRSRFVVSDDQSHLIANLMTQPGVGGGRPVSYDMVADSFDELNEFCFKHSYTEVAMPRIGAGLGGGDWNVVVALIHAHLPNVNVVVYDLDTQPDTQYI